MTQLRSSPLAPHATVSHVSKKVRVMLVDDSLVVRGILRKILIADPEIEVVASVGNGKLAVEELDRTDIDAVILDIEMPIMDGITALPLMLKKKSDLVVLVASTLSLKNADISMRCLELGAKDYVPKPTTQTIAGDEDAFKRELLTKLKVITQSLRDKRKAAPAGLSRPIDTTGGRPLTPGLSPANVAQSIHEQSPSSADVIALRSLPQKKPEALVIGASTGGPQALSEVFRNARGKFKQPIFIAQHMPPLFTKSLAAHLERISGIPAKEGEDGEIIQGGRIYVAPGDYHMAVEVVGSNKVIRLSKGPHENFCRPSVNPLLRSVAEAYGGNALCAMLTGLGSDGSQGAQYLVDKGGSVIAQDKESSVVWGMPGAVTVDGLCSAVLPLKDIQHALDKISNTLNPKFGVKL